MTAVALSGETRTQLEEALAVLAELAPADPETRRDRLYAEWYALPRQRGATSFAGPPDLVELLRAAHTGFQDWQCGWRIEDIGPRGQAVVRRGADLRLVERTDYSPTARRGLLPRPGDEVAVTSRRDRVDRDDGWWRTGGRSWSWGSAPAGLVRLYFNHELDALPILVSRLTGLLADEPEPWLLKCATNAAVHARSDAVVAYLGHGTLERWAAQIVELALATGHVARPERPPLTMPVVPGLSAAVDPGGDESFGTNRCRLIAEAATDTLDAVVDRFVSEGVDPGRPWARRDDRRLPWER